MRERCESALTDRESRVSRQTRDPHDDDGRCPVTHACHSRTHRSGGGFTTEVVVTNNGSSPISGWTATFQFDGGEQLTASWNAEVSQSGSTVTASNSAGHWNGTIPVGGSAQFGVQGTGQLTSIGNAALNQTSCTTS